MTAAAVATAQKVDRANTGDHLPMRDAERPIIIKVDERGSMAASMRSEVRVRSSRTVGAVAAEALVAHGEFSPRATVLADAVDFLIRRLHASRWPNGAGVIARHQLRGWRTRWTRRRSRWTRWTWRRSSGSTVGAVGAEALGAPGKFSPRSAVIADAVVGIAIICLICLTVTARVVALRRNSGHEGDVDEDAHYEQRRTDDHERAHEFNSHPPFHQPGLIYL